MATDKFNFLDDERKKLWAEVEILRHFKKNQENEILSLKEKILEIEGSIPDDVKAIKNASKLVTEYKNRVTANRDESLAKLDEINHHYQIITDNLREIDAIKETAVLRITDIEAYEDNISKVNDKANESVELFEDLETIKSRLSILNTLSDDTKSTQQKISQNLTNSSKFAEEIKEIYYDIVGHAYQDENGQQVEIDGKVDELNEVYTELTSQAEATKKSLIDINDSSKKSYAAFTDDCTKKLTEQNTAWEAKVNEVVHRINSLLPNALTAGLSHAYYQKRIEEQASSAKLSKRFAQSIFALAVVSLLPVTIGVYYAVSTGLEKAIDLLPNLATAIIPIYIPFLWLAYSINKRLNLSKRLVEEYTHKEVLSNTFEGLSKQVESIKDDYISSDLRIKLLYNLLNVSSENPGKLISDYNKSDHPVLDVIEKSSMLSDAVESLSKIPGISSLSRLLEKRADLLNQSQTVKVENGIDLAQSTMNKKIVQIL
jgi:hypothetical protein